MPVPTFAPPRPAPGADPDGVLLVDKPAGVTSSDVVVAVRRMFRLKKVGHGGTLRLGAATNTQDAEGEVVSRGDPSAVTRESLEALVASDFSGDIFQVPPMVSAIKVDGVPLYRMARKGEEVEREPRLVHVFSLRIDEFGIPDTRFTVRCSKGTYVRTLCHDIGKKLGCGGHLAALRRIRAGRFDVADAIPLDELRALPRADLPSRLLPLSVLL